jgi:hypothetical protein
MVIRNHFKLIDPSMRIQIAYYFMCCYASYYLSFHVSFGCLSLIFYE